MVSNGHFWSWTDTMQIEYLDCDWKLPLLHSLTIGIEFGRAHVHCVLKVTPKYLIHCKICI